MTRARTQKLAGADGVLPASFLDAIAGGPAVRNNARVGRESLTIPFAAEQAVREHKVIEL